MRKEFAARLTCSRVNPHAGCDSVEAMLVEFTARDKALAARLDVGGGRLLAPVVAGHEATLTTVSFKPPVPSAITARLLLPAGLTDISGRVLANAAPLLSASN